jgi:hypothetical protein
MKTQKLMTRKILAAVLVAALPLACGEEVTPVEESVDAAACEHLAGAEVVAVTAAAVRDQAPAVAADHHRYEIALGEIEGGRGGFVSFASEQAGDVLFFLDADVPVKLVDAAGAAVAFEQSVTSSSECALIKGRHLAELPVGTVWLQFGPAAVEKVNLVVEGAEHDAEHHHD